MGDPNFGMVEVDWEAGIVRLQVGSTVLFACMHAFHATLPSRYRLPICFVERLYHGMLKSSGMTSLCCIPAGTGCTRGWGGAVVRWAAAHAAHHIPVHM